jgi:hypothetical protein
MRAKLGRLVAVILVLVAALALVEAAHAFALAPGYAGCVNALAQIHSGVTRAKAEQLVQQALANGGELWAPIPAGTALSGEGITRVSCIRYRNDTANEEAYRPLFGTILGAVDIWAQATMNGAYNQTVLVLTLATDQVDKSELQDCLVMPVDVDECRQHPTRTP